MIVSKKRARYYHLCIEALAAMHSSSGVFALALARAAFLSLSPLASFATFFFAGFMMVFIISTQHKFNSQSHTIDVDLHCSIWYMHVCVYPVPRPSIREGVPCRDDITDGCKQVQS